MKPDAPEAAPDSAPNPATAPSSTSASASPRATYEVGRPTQAAEPTPRAAADARPTARPVAVFVAHGMGQQIPFATLDLVSEGLRREDARRRGVPISSLPPPRASSVALGEERLQRAELTLIAAEGSEQEVHLYEGYWAPLTEGQVKLHDVVAFLLRGAWNGILSAARKKGFRRWLFGEYPWLPVPASTLLLLGVAAAVIVALVALNAAVALVAVARSPLQNPPRWLGDALFADLTTLMNVFVTLALLFGLTLLAARGLRGKPRPLRAAAGALSVGAFALVLGGTALAGLSLPILFWAHVRCATGDAGRGVLRHTLGAGFVDGFDRAFSAGALALLAGAGGVLVLFAVAKLLAGAAREMRAGGVRAVAYTLGLLGVAAVLASLAGEIRAAASLCREAAGFPAVQRGISWPLLFAISAWVRSLLIQYPGDVAAYVTPQALDRFQKLRTDIKETVWQRAHAVYAEKRAAGAEDFLYPRVAVVGHSLGSVIAYDVLNRMIQEDETSPAGGRLDTVGRTPIFLTFGSPLDKTAFVFGVAGKSTTEAREALAAAKQPLICDYRFRPARWVNLFSPWDVVSGSLDYYDLPGATDARRVENRRDPEATTLIAAHLEYWENPLLFEILHAELVAGAAGAAP